MKELIKIQSELSVEKMQVNKFGKYKYRSCDDIFQALKKFVKELNVIVTTSDEIVIVGDRVYVKATATIKNLEGETESVTAYAREAKDQKGMAEAQITGSSSSYARKYALSGLFAIDNESDDDVTNTHGKKSRPAAKPKAKPKTIQERQGAMFKAFGELKVNAIEIMQYLDIEDDDPRDLTTEEIKKLGDIYKDISEGKTTADIVFRGGE